MTKIDLLLAERSASETKLYELNAFNSSAEFDSLSVSQQFVSRIKAGALYTYVECLTAEIANM